MSQAAINQAGGAARASEAKVSRSPFSAKALIAVLTVGIGAFMLLLYALGAGWDGSEERGGEAHAASNGLNGYSGLVALLQARGHDVSTSREEEARESEALIVLTPSRYSDATELATIINERRYFGPTVVILPKWAAYEPPERDEVEIKDDWVSLSYAWAPPWFNDLNHLDRAALRNGKTSGWAGLGLSGKLPDPKQVQAVSQHRSKESLGSQDGDEEDAPVIIMPTPADDSETIDPLEGLIEGDTNTGLIPMVRDGEGDILVGFLDDNGYYPDLSYDAGKVFSAEEEADQDEDARPVVFIIEPDLVNNYGMADLGRAELAESIILSSFDGYDYPIIFDLSLHGKGETRNLLTLAFQPPFLAATICLLFAALVILWRSFARFGPPIAEIMGFAKGKTALARNVAFMVERAKRLHLLGPPFAEMVSRRLAKTLGIPLSEPVARNSAIDEALAKTDYSGPNFTSSANALRNAKKPQELLRAARALKTIERTLEP